MTPADFLVGLVLGIAVGVGLAFLAWCPEPDSKYRRRT